MRSQASKPSPKRGDLSKTSVKSKKIRKKSVSPKKVKQLAPKTLVKGNKKTLKDESNNKKDGESSTSDKNESAPEKTSQAKTTFVRNDSPSGKAKKDPKEKKDTVKTSPQSRVKKIVTKKMIKKGKTKPNIKDTVKNNDAKYKSNKPVSKKATLNFSKAKTIVKKSKSTANTQKKKQMVQTTSESESKESDTHEDMAKTDKEAESQKSGQDKGIEDKEDIKNTTKEGDSDNSKTDVASSNQLINTPPKVPPSNQPETPKAETERPPKFFTSSRSPRMVDIDVKCLKNSKGNLSVSERFLSMKCETKTEDNSKDKSNQNTLVSQGPDIDVYTFTEKVDSPKSILSDFRSPINKNVGRVRPIARVKGTVINKKAEVEKKKYSPHRPIEEVVKQLKANKRSEELRASQEGDAASSFNIDNDKKDNESEDSPKPIVSKSYKMVARKSSVTGKPFSPIKFMDQELPTSDSDKTAVKLNTSNKKQQNKSKKVNKSSSDDELESSKFLLNNKKLQYSSSEESHQDSNDDDSKESSGSDSSKNKKPKNKKYKKIIDSVKKPTCKELKELSKDSLVDIKDEKLILGNDKPSKRRRKLLSMWNGPKKHRMASLNAIAKVHCLYENESRTHMELGLMRTVDRQPIPSTSKPPASSKKKENKIKVAEKHDSTSESEYETKKDKKEDSSESSDDSRPQRTLRGVPGIRSAGKYWDPKSSTSSSEDSELDTKKKSTPEKKKIAKTSSGKSDSEKPPPKMKKTAGVPVKKKRNRNEVVMDLKDMVVQKRMASLNATAILAASYEKRSPKSSKDETTSDSCSDESFSQKSKNGVSSGVKSEIKKEETKKEKECEDGSVSDRKQKVEVIVNQDTDVTITGVYSTHHHEGFCTVSGMQYRISSTSHTQTTATANCEKEGCSRDDEARYTPLSALSSMQPPAEHAHAHPHPVAELGGLARRAGCSSAFSAPSPSSAHHEPGYYQPAGPLIKESSNEDRALARYHAPHYHAPHPPVLQQYGPPYYPDLCYGRYYRPPGPYHMPPPQPDAAMGGIPSEPYPPPQYYGTPPCYQHSQPRIPYVEYRGCSCPLNACPKNVLIGPATGKAPAGSGPDVPSALAPPGGAFRSKVRVCALDTVADTHGSGKDPPLEPEPPAATDAPHPCPLPAIGGASPKRELFDVRESLRIGSEVCGPSEAVGPPSPARGSAGVCAPQPPTSAPRRARLGKAMARRSLAGDDTRQLLSAPLLPPAHSDADDDVLAISPPICAPIDLSSSDERTTPLVDIKKENEGPTFASARKPDAQALKEHNSAVGGNDANFANDTNKAVKRRYSRPKLEIDMKDTQLEEGCKTNGIGEHVKLVKRRKVSGDQSETPRSEVATKEPKKKSMQTKKIPKSPKASQTPEKKTVKRKLEGNSNGPRTKKILVESPSSENAKVTTNVTATNGVPAVKDKEEILVSKPKTKSALLLDNLIRKNSIDRADSNGYSSDKELNPADLFLSPIENIGPNSGKKTLNINNNIVENKNTNGVRPKTIAAVSQLIEKKLAYKNACKLEKVDSKVTTHNRKSVLKPPSVQTGPIEDNKTMDKCEPLEVNNLTNVIIETAVPKPLDLVKVDKANESKELPTIPLVSDKTEQETLDKTLKPKLKPNLIDIPDKPDKESQKPKEQERTNRDIDRKTESEKKTRNETCKTKRCKLTNGELKSRNVEKVAKLLVWKRPGIKTDEATLVVEEACEWPGGGYRRAKRRGSRKARRALEHLAPPPFWPRTLPRWSNGWTWDGEQYIAKVYLNNDTRMDRVARCWTRMCHASGDRVSRGDCVLLRASVARAQPFVARIASLWESPDDGEMMVSLVWFYRPEHTECGRQPTDAPDEVFASRHRDANSVACIEDKCYVLGFNEYCRYRKRLKAAEEGFSMASTKVPPLSTHNISPEYIPTDSKLPPAVSSELVLFCRRVYDFRSKKLQASSNK